MSQIIAICWIWVLSIYYIIFLCMLGNAHKNEHLPQMIGGAKELFFWALFCQKSREERFLFILLYSPSFSKGIQSQSVNALALPYFQITNFKTKKEVSYTRYVICIPK